MGAQDFHLDRVLRCKGLKGHAPQLPQASTIQNGVRDEKDVYTYENPPCYEQWSGSSKLCGRQGTAFDEERLRGLPKQFHPNKQLRKLLFHGLCRWLVTAILILFIYVAIWCYYSKGVMTQANKLRFNALVTGLSIALGLSIASSLKAMAVDMRGWILSRRGRSPREIDLILHSDSLGHLLRLVSVSPRFNVIAGVSLWLMLKLAAEVGVALLGLTYSVDTADNSAITSPGNVGVSDMSTIKTAKVLSSSSQAERALQYTANSFGTVALAFNWDFIENLPEPRSVWTQDDASYFSGSDYFEFVFLEFSPPPNVSVNATPIYITTNRTINSTGICDSWPVTEGGDGKSRNITIKLDSSGNTTQKIIPIAAGEAQTTFITDPSEDCGDGCSRVAAFEASLQDSFYYECSVTVGAATNVTRAEHEVGPSLRKLASAAIALQGYVASSLSNATNLQFQTYPAESIYGTPKNGSASQMAFLMAQFAIGVVIVAAESNPFLTVPGDQPQIGVVLNVPEWKYVHLILGMLGGLQLALFIVTAFVASGAVVKDDSVLATADC